MRARYESCGGISYRWTGRGRTGVKGAREPEEPPPTRARRGSPRTRRSRCWMPWPVPLNRSKIDTYTCVGVYYLWR